MSDEVDDGYVLEVAWEPGIDLPSLIGPFATEVEAWQWANLNVPNGLPVVRKLAWPYARAGGAS